MNEWGIQLDLDGENKYITYTLPEDWDIVDETEFREDMPDWYIVDNNMNKRVSISGVWKGTYDNRLTLSICEEPWEKHVSKTRDPAPSETSPAAIAGKFADALSKDRK